MFGEVLNGKSVVRQIENLRTESGDRPTSPVVITDCGELTGDEALKANEKTPDATGDPHEDYPEDYGTDLDAKTVLKIATDCKDFGNKAFKAGDLAVAVGKYEKGLRYLNEEPELDKEPETTGQALTALRFSLNNNAALLNIKLEAWEDAIRHATNALDVKGTADADRAKAFYRRGVGYVRSKDEESALGDLEAAHKLAPNDSAVANELRAVQTKVAAKSAKAKAAFKKFFD